MFNLGLLQIRKFFDQFFLPETGKADRQFDVVAGAFAPEHQTFAVFRMPDMRAGRKPRFGFGLWILDFGLADALRRLSSIQKKSYRALIQK